MTSRPPSTERKRQFRNLLNQQDGVTVLDQKGRPTAWDVDTPTGKKIVWLHYDVNFDWWKVSRNPSYDYTEEAELLHVFLGPSSEDYYVVPHDDFMTRFEHYSNKDNSEWILNAAGDAKVTKENLRTLSNYTSLGRIWE